MRSGNSAEQFGIQEQVFQIGADIGFLAMLVSGAISCWPGRRTMRSGQPQPVSPNEGADPLRTAHHGANFARKAITVFGLDALHAANVGDQQIARARRILVDNRLNVLAGRNQNNIADRVRSVRRAQGARRHHRAERRQVLKQGKEFSACYWKIIS